jgi:hypothetical protein
MQINKVFAGMLVAVVAFAASADAQTYTFTRSLSQGARGADVMNLQKVLNMCADTQVSASGVGSSGKETQTFGPATKAAVMKWQTKVGVNPIGIFGPASRAAYATKGNACGTGGVVLPPAQTGPVSASLSSTTPASGVVVAGQATAELAQFTLTGSGTVNSMTLRRTGISDQNTLSNVYLFEGNTRLTDGYSFNTAGEIVMNNLNLMVNGSRSISVRADISSASTVVGQTVGVSLVSVSAGTSVSTANLSGNLMSIASGATLGSVVISGSNTGTAGVNAGTMAYTFWRQSVQVSTRTVELRSAAFRMIGSAPSDALSNIKLFVNGVDTGRVASVMPIQGTNYAMFDFGSSPVVMPTGSHTVELRADIMKGANRTVSFSLQQAADLMILDPQVRVNIAPVNATTPSVVAFTPKNGGTVTINTGSTTVTVDPAFSALTNITGGASNVAIAKYQIRSFGEDVKVNSLSVTPVLGSMTPAAAGLDDVTLYFNGSQIGSSQDWTTGALAFNLGSQLIVPAGQTSVLEVRANLRTTGGSNYTAGTVSANLNVGSGNAQGQSSFDPVNFPAGLITGNTLTVQTGLLAVSANAGYASQNANPNTQGVKIGAYTFQNQSSSESVRVTNLLVGLTFGAGTSANNFSGIWTSENPTYVVQPSTSNTFSVDFTLAPGATKTVDILANSGADTGTTATIASTLTVTSLGVLSNVSATSSAMSGQTITFRTGTVGTPTIITSSPASPIQFVAAANGGSANGSRAVYKFASTNAPSTVTELTFSVTSGTASSVSVGNASAPVVAGVAYLTGLNIAVPNGGAGVNVDVYVTYPEVGTSGVASNTDSTLTLTTVKYTSGSTTASLTSLTVNAPTMTLVGSVPTVVATKPTSQLAVGNVEAINVTVSASPKGDLVLNTLPVNVSATAATVSTSANTIIVRDANNQTVATTNTAFGAAAGGASTITFTGGYTIQAGQPATFKVFVPVATVTGTGVNGASISTSLPTGANFSWTDTSGGGSSPITGTTKIPSYPSTFTAVTFN